MSTAEEAFQACWERNPFDGVAMEREFRFHPVRRWRFDFCWPTVKLALEVDGRGKGGQHGGHHTVEGVRKDCDKGNTALLMGWRVMHVPATDYGTAALWVEQVHAMIRVLQGRPYIVVESKPPMRRVTKARRELTLAECRAQTRAEQAEAKAARVISRALAVTKRKMSDMG